MRRFAIVLGIVAAAALLATVLMVSPMPSVRAQSAINWTLTWSDEFTGPQGATPDSSKWTMETGGNGWGNAELESYTSRPENASIDTSQGADGALVITARNEPGYVGTDGIARDYTSARMTTANSLAQAYGKFEARLKIPHGQGMWPAFWMLGANIGTVGWPGCGELDIMENVGKDPGHIFGTIHGPGYSGAQGISVTGSLPGNAAFADDWHVYGVEWAPDVVRWTLDGTAYGTRSINDLPAGTDWVFDHPFFVIMNVAVGGSWPGNPDATTVFPQTMLVDYVRAYSTTDVIPVPTPTTPPTPTPAGPFLGAPVPLPGVVQAENFDYGGEGVAYHDLDPTNNGGAYRPTEGVDIGGSGDTDGTPSVGWTGAGEWLNYAVNIAQAGQYTFSARVGYGGVGGNLHIDMVGVVVTGAIIAPNTGGWG
jgi:beta-glucanase (GH16 family)